jgi:hypothetical protein
VSVSVSVRESVCERESECVCVHLQSLHCLRWRLCWHMDFCDFRFPVLSCAYALCVHSSISTLFM